MADPNEYCEDRVRVVEPGGNISERPLSDLDSTGQSETWREVERETEVVEIPEGTREIEVATKSVIERGGKGGRIEIEWKKP